MSNENSAKKGTDSSAPSRLLAQRAEQSVPIFRPAGPWSKVAATRLRKFASLPTPDRLLLIEAAATLAAVRLALWLLPTRMLLRPVRPRPTAHNPQPTARLLWSIQAVAPAIPKSTCLVRALAARHLLARRGIPATLRIGVAKSPDFQAHAWLEHNGSPLLNAAGLDQYTPLPANL